MVCEGPDSFTSLSLRVSKAGYCGVKYVKDGDVGWIPVVRRRRKKCARSEESDSSGYVNDKRRSLLRYRKVDGIPGI